MAGIGIEFRRFFVKRSVLSAVRGFAYSLTTTLTPILAVIVVLLAMFQALGYDQVRYARRELLSAAILYAFVFSLQINAGLGAVLSRFIANKLYQEDTKSVQSAFWAGLMLSMGAAALLGIPFQLRVWLVGGVEPLFALGSYCLFASVTLAFYVMIFIAAVKDYKRVSLFFAAGMAFAFALGALLVYGCGADVVTAIVYALTGGFLIISALEYGYARSLFPQGEVRFREVLQCFSQWRSLFFANQLYSLGLFAHNIVFWVFSGLRVVVADSYLCAPLYDKASCVAMYTNALASVIFIVQTESHFTDRYKLYSEMLLSGRLVDIDKAKKRMFRMLSHIVLSVAEMQFIAATGLFLVFLFLMPRLGFYGLTMSVYPSLVAGFFALYVMYGQLMYLFYFNDDRGALYTASIFLAGTVVFSLLAVRHLTITWYGMGLFAGAFLAWTYGCARLRWLERTFDEHIFCTGELIPTRREAFPDGKVYNRDTPQDNAAREGGVA